jgi:hypothetical protein
MLVTPDISNKDAKDSACIRTVAIPDRYRCSTTVTGTAHEPFSPDRAMGYTYFL